MQYNKWKLYPVLGHLPFQIFTEFISNNISYQSISLNDQGLWYDSTLVYDSSWVNKNFMNITFLHPNQIIDEVFLEWIGLNGEPDQGVAYGL